jgi:mono/diheme cytochrome c family protein
MLRSRLNWFLFVLIAGMLVLAWSIDRDVTEPNFESVVEGQMRSSPAYGSFERNPNFSDQLTLRRPPEGTIARGNMPFLYKASAEDAVKAGLELPNPFSEKDKAKLLRGSVVFANFCQVCHGPFGQGDGPVTQGGFPLPPSLVTDRAMRMPDGEMFHVLTFGQGRMPAIAPQLTPEDRWSAILHVRRLQRSQKPTLAVTLPEVVSLFKQNCMACHGEDGSGNIIRKTLPNIPDFTSLAWQVSQTEIAIVNQIDYGSLPLMPAFRYKLTREQIQGLAVYIRSFANRQPGTPPPVTVNISPVSVWQTYCFVCHDTTGKGVASYRQVMPELPDFTSAAWQASRTNMDLKHSILEGKGKFMQSMKDKLGAVNAEEMVALVREFKDGKVIPMATPRPPGPPAPEKIVTIPPDWKELFPSKDFEKPLPEPSGELAGKIRAGASLFQQFCIICHGPDGTGDFSRSRLPPIPNFTDPAWQLKKEDVEILVSIMDGKGTLMPANSDKLTREQGQQLVAFVRSFGPPRPPGPLEQSDFEKMLRQLQLQFDRYEREIQKLKGQPDQQK